MVQEGVKSQPVSWQRFVELVKGKYIPENVKRDLALEFKNVKQGQRTVAQCDYEFNRLSRYAPNLVSTEEDKIHRFIWGLRPEISSTLTVQEFMVTKMSLIEHYALRVSYEELILLVRGHGLVKVRNHHIPAAVKDHPELKARKEVRIPPHDHTVIFVDVGTTERARRHVGVLLVVVPEI